MAASARDMRARLRLIATPPPNPQPLTQSPERFGWCEMVNSPVVERAVLYLLQGRMTSKMMTMHLLGIRLGLLEQNVYGMCTRQLTCPSLRSQTIMNEVYVLYSATLHLTRADGAQGCYCTGSLLRASGKQC